VLLLAKNTEASPFHTRGLFGSDIPFGTMEIGKILSQPIGDEKKGNAFVSRKRPEQ